MIFQISKRPYYLEYKVSSDKVVLVPLRSNCPQKSPYTLPIKTTRTQRNHGFDFSKMLIISPADSEKFLTKSYVGLDTRKDIKRKENIIFRKIEKTISDYNVMLEKDLKGDRLSKNEIFLKERSTLRNYYKPSEKQKED